MTTRLDLENENLMTTFLHTSTLLTSSNPLYPNLSKLDITTLLTLHLFSQNALNDIVPAMYYYYDHRSNRCTYPQRVIYVQPLILASIFPFPLNFVEKRGNTKYRFFLVKKDSISFARNGTEWRLVQFLFLF